MRERSSDKSDSETLKQKLEMSFAKAIQINAFKQDYRCENPVIRSLANC